MANHETLESMHRRQEAAFLAQDEDALALIGIDLDKNVTDGVVAGHPEASAERPLMDFNGGRGERPFEFSLGLDTVEAIRSWTENGNTEQSN